jgi:hypothetical protein
VARRPVACLDSARPRAPGPLLPGRPAAALRHGRRSRARRGVRRRGRGHGRRGIRRGAAGPARRRVGGSPGARPPSRHYRRRHPRPRGAPPRRADRRGVRGAGACAGAGLWCFREPRQACAPPSARRGLGDRRRAGGVRRVCGGGGGKVGSAAFPRAPEGAPPHPPFSFCSPYPSPYCTLTSLSLSSSRPLCGVGGVPCAWVPPDSGAAASWMKRWWSHCQAIVMKPL